MTTDNDLRAAATEVWRWANSTQDGYPVDLVTQANEAAMWQRLGVALAASPEPTHTVGLRPDIGLLDEAPEPTEDALALLMQDDMGEARGRA